MNRVTIEDVLKMQVNTQGRERTLRRYYIMKDDVYKTMIMLYEHNQRSRACDMSDVLEVLDCIIASVEQSYGIKK